VQDAERLFLDANILIRAVLGRRVRSLLCRHGGSMRFFAPEYAFQEAREHLPSILHKRSISAEEGSSVLNSVGEIVQSVYQDTYGAFERVARMRLSVRDIEDWPVLATA
jgi:predicted nucleic acid-binding protein